MNQYKKGFYYIRPSFVLHVIEIWNKLSKEVKAMYMILLQVNFFQRHSKDNVG